jgi:hypothetical protein
LASFSAKDRLAEARFAEIEVRSQTGIGAGPSAVAAREPAAAAV